MALCYDTNRILEWAVPQLDICLTSGARALGRTNSEGELVGAVLFDNWCGATCELHMVGKDGHWASKELVRSVFEYVFIARKCKAIVTKVTNPRAFLIDLRVGFELQYILHGVHRDGPMYHLIMWKQNCRFLRS
jgi:hypothetical protein